MARVRLFEILPMTSKDNFKRAMKSLHSCRGMSKNQMLIEESALEIAYCNNKGWL